MKRLTVAYGRCLSKGYALTLMFFHMDILYLAVFDFSPGVLHFVAYMAIGGRTLFDFHFSKVKITMFSGVIDSIAFA